MKAKLRAFVHLAFAAMLLVTSGVALAGDDFPGRKPDRRVLKTQEKVDSLFEKGDYERAGFIYREELAPLGDKYAQYMLGYMYLTGKGRPSDIVAASAWYRLAAERGHALFSQARDEIWQLMDEQQRDQSDQTYIGLRSEYGDAMLIAIYIESDLDVLSSRIEISSLKRDLVGTGYYNNVEDSKRYDKVVKSVEARLDFLAQILVSDELHEADDLRRYAQLQERASILISSYKDGN